MRRSVLAAPLLLIVLRFAQGIAIGGQWGGAVLIATENAPPQRRGFYGSFAQVGAPVGVILANLAFLLMSANTEPEAFMQWGWRVPFIVSVVLIGLALYVQLRLEDTVEFLKLQRRSAPVATLAGDRSAAHASEADRARSRRIPGRAGPVLHPDRVRDRLRHGRGGTGCVAQHDARRSAGGSGRDDSRAAARRRVVRSLRPARRLHGAAPHCSRPGASRSFR